MNDRSETNTTATEPQQPPQRSEKPQSARSQPRSRRRRWLRSLFVAVLLVIVLAIGGAQVILWSDFPRNLVVNQLERQLGLRITARTLSTGWFGHTTLRDVTAALPLSDDHFITMPRMEVRHTSLVRMIFGRPLRLDRLEVHRPTLLIQQYGSGRWNIQEAIEVVDRATRRPAAAPGDTRVTSASIPELLVRDATVRIIDNRGNDSRITPVEISGVRDGPIVYRFGGAVPQRLKLEGQIVPGGFWQHEFELAAEQPDDWIRPFIEVPSDTHVRANWRGQKRNGDIVGRVYFNPIRANARTATGFVQASIIDGRITFQPQNLLVQTDFDAAPQLMIDSGSIVLDGQSIRARELRLSGAGGNAQLNGMWDWGGRSAQLHVVWDDLILREGVSQTGSINATLETVFPNHPRIEGTLVSSGSIAGGGGDWEARLHIQGRGESFQSINWQGHFERLLYDWRRDFDLSGLTLLATQRPGRITLDNLSLPQRGRITGRGEIDFTRQDWWLWLSGSDVGLPRAPAETPLTFDLNVGGSFQFVDVKGIYLSAGDMEFWANGFYDTNRPQPIELHALLTHVPHYGDERWPLVRGWLRAETDVIGTLLPLQLNITGEVRGRDLHFRDYNLGDPRGVLTGNISARSILIQTQQLRLLDAHWEIEGDWPVDPAKSFELSVSVNRLPLEELGDLFGDERISGVADVQLKLLIPEPRLEALLLEGSFLATDLAAEPFRAERVTGTVALRDGVLRAEPLELRESNGTATATARASLRSLEQWFVQLKAQQWPVDVRHAGSILTAVQADLRVDLVERAIWGDVHVEGNFTREGSEVGSAAIDITADGRALRLTRLEGQVLRGTFSGAGSYLLDDPNRTKLLLEWRALDAGMLATWIPELEEFSGVYSGRLDVEPTDDPRALGPLGMNFALRSPDGGWRALPLTSVELTAFANLTGDVRQFHLVTRDATLRLADGDATAFARISRRRDDGTLSALINADFTRLSLDRIVQAADPGADPMPGRLTGKLSLAGDPHSPRAIFGDLNLTLTESDLANFDPVGTLYDLMRVGGAREGTTGTGQILARIDNQSLQVTQFYLFNRGVEVRGAGSIENIYRIPDTPIEGTLVGTARPLAALRIPFMADVDQIFSALQGHATTVEVSGTLRQPDVRPTTLDEVGDAVRALLVGEVQRERGGGGR